ncbi:MAG: OmpH family outer membrane protein [Fimbriimonadales bacterium]|nr:OmpH family outer membrane protein [Fimbriimonadales bacterium]
MRTFTGILAIAALFTLAHAQTVGMVDYERIIKEAQFAQDTQRELEALGQRYQQAFQTLQENLILTDEERQELTNLLLQPNLNDQQKKRVDALKATARQRGDELQALRQKATPTETEKAALERFTQMEARSREALQILGQQWGQEFERQAQTQSSQVQKRIREVIAQVAKEKKIQVVFPANMVLYCESDLTDEVIKRLNAKK